MRIVMVGCKWAELLRSGLIIHDSWHIIFITGFRELSWAYTFWLSILGG